MAQFDWNQLINYSPHYLCEIAGLVCRGFAFVSNRVYSRRQQRGNRDAPRREKVCKLRQSKRRQKTSARLSKSISMPGKAPMNAKFSPIIQMTSYSTLRREHSKERPPCKTTLCAHLSPGSLAMYIP